MGQFNVKYLNLSTILRSLYTINHTCCKLDEVQRIKLKLGKKIFYLSVTLYLKLVFKNESFTCLRLYQIELMVKLGRSNKRTLVAPRACNVAQGKHFSPIARACHHSTSPVNNIFFPFHTCTSVIQVWLLPPEKGKKLRPSIIFCTIDLVTFKKVTKDLDVYGKRHVTTRWLPRKQLAM